MVSVPVNPDVLIWARKERGFTQEAASLRLDWPLQRLIGYEQGEADPTLGDLKKISGKYQIPLASLLMPEPLPASHKPKLRDFRIMRGGEVPTFSPETCLSIDEAFLLVDCLVDIKNNNPTIFSRLSTPHYTKDNEASSVAVSERNRLGVSVIEQVGWKNARHAFLSWREVIEDQGIYCCQLKLGDDDVRDFAIYDDSDIPVIVVDASEDGYAAKTYTLLHEYAHILLRSGGISDQNRNNSVERYCNKFAAYFLMPEADFVEHAGIVLKGARFYDDRHVDKLSDIFKTSKSSVAIHLEDLGLAPEGFYDRMVAIWKLREPPTGGGIATYIEKNANKFGGRYINTVFGSVLKGEYSKLDAFDITRVRPEFYADIVREAQNRRAAYGRQG